MWIQPRELHHAWRLAYMEATESGHVLLLHWENIHFGGEFLPLHQALLQGHGAQFPAARCLLSMDGEAVTWLLAQRAANARPYQPSPWETPNPSLHWLGATAGMHVCVINSLAARAVVNGMGQGIYGDSPHAQRALAPLTSLDRALLPRQFIPGVIPPPAATAKTGARLPVPGATTGVWASWLGFLTALVMFLFGFTQFLLRIL